MSGGVGGEEPRGFPLSRLGGYQALAPSSGARLQPIRERTLGRLQPLVPLMQLLTHRRTEPASVRAAYINLSHSQKRTPA